MTASGQGRWAQRCAGAVLPAAVALLTLVAFLPSLQNDFVNWDDHEYVTENPWIREASGANLQAIWTESRAANYHPLVFMTHLAEYRLWRLHPAGYHAVNLSLHVITTLFVFGFVLALGVGRWTAALAALWFGVHPLHVESVAWVAERKDVLCGVFYMLGLWLYVLSRARGGKGLFVGAVAAYVLALLSKPMAVTWPVVAALCDRWIGRKATRAWWIEKALLFVPALVVMAVTVRVQETKRGIQPELVTRLWSNVLTAGRAFAFYLGKLVAPVRLCAFYPRTGWHHAIPLPVAVGLGAALVLALVWWAWRTRRRVLLFGLAWYVVTLLPVSGIVPIGFVFAADRYMYLPSVGPLFVLASALGGAAAAWPRSRGLVAGLAVLSAAACLVLTWQRCHVWRNGETLWLDTTRRAPNHLTLRMLGMAQLSAGKLKEAEASLLRSFEDSETQYGRFYMGEVLRHQGRHEQALGWYRKFLNQQDWYVPALSGYGISLMALGRTEEAIPVFVDCANREPAAAAHLARLGWALMELKRWDEAESVFLAALQRDPNEMLALYNHGVMLMWQERLGEAESRYRQVLARDPSHHAARVNLGVVLRMQGRYAEALAVLRQALASVPDDPVAQAELRAIPAE